MYDMPATAFIVPPTSRRAIDSTESAVISTVVEQVSSNSATNQIIFDLSDIPVVRTLSLQTGMPSHYRACTLLSNAYPMGIHLRDIMEI